MYSNVRISKPKLKTVSLTNFGVKHKVKSLEPKSKTKVHYYILSPYLHSIRSPNLPLVSSHNHQQIIDGLLTNFSQNWRIVHISEVKI